MRALGFFGIAACVAALAAAAYVYVPGAGAFVALLLPGSTAAPAGEAGGSAATAATGSEARKDRQGVAVIAVAASKADFPIRERAIGFIHSPGVVNVSARVSSQITEQHVKDGQMVKAGDLLFSLDDRALKAQLATAQAAQARDQALLVSAQANTLRARNLVQKQAGTQQTLDEAVATEKAAQATIDSDQAAIDAAQVQLGFATITAPISGRLGAIQVTPGNLVSTGGGSGSTAATLVTITQTDPLEVDFNLPESKLPLLRKAMSAGEPAPVRVYRKDDDTPLASGALDFVDSTVDQASGTIAVKATIPNASLALWPGQYVDVELEAGTLAHATTVPSVAVQLGQQGSFVYLVKADETVEIRPVVVALADGDTTALKSGLEPGDQVVTEGQIRLKAGTHVAVSQEGDAAKPPAKDNTAEAEPAAGTAAKP